MAIRFARYLVLFALIASLPLAAQDNQDSDDDTEAPAHYASLSISIRDQDRTHVSLNVEDIPADWAPVENTLAASLGCRDLRHPATPSPRTFASLTAEQQKAYNDAVITYARRQISGECVAPLSRSGLTYSAQLDLTALLSVLRAGGTESLAVVIYRPRAPAGQFSSAYRISEPRSEASTQSSSYLFPKEASTAKIAFAYGYAQADVLRMAAFSFAYVALPLIVLLWLRRAALSAEGDPTAAWFSYFRAMNWCINGAIFLWCLTRLSPRQELIDVARFAGASGVSGWLADIAITLAPMFAIYVPAVWTSYAVFARFRGASVSRREYVLGRTLQLGTVLLPLNLMIGGAVVMVSDSRSGAMIMVVAVVTFIVFAQWRVRVTRSMPMPVTTGELRDRIFGLAAKIGVRVKQVFVMPASRMQLANAFAARNGVVMFTDYLLQRLEKREVDAIAAHELTHLRHKHPAKLSAMLLAVILLPAGFASVLSTIVTMTALMAQRSHWLSAATTLRVMTFSSGIADSWWRDLVWFSLGMLLFYFLARRFEKTADLGALAATQDGEALITGLVKVSNLNLMPLHWGRATGAALTHPSTMRRLQYIAAAAGLPQERIPLLIASSATACKQPGSLYAGTDEAAVEEGSRKALQTATTSQKKAWILIGLHFLPAASVALLLQWTLLPGTPRLALQALGIVLTLALYILGGHWMALRSRARLRGAVAARVRKLGLPVDTARSTLVGFAPGPCPRYYLNSYDFDRGFLLLSRGRLHYLGEQAKFALSAQQVVAIEYGPGAPSWFNFPRIYVRWVDSSGAEQVFSVSAADPCGMFEVRPRIAILYQRLSAWHMGVSDQVRAPEELASLAPPSLGEVTCLTPREVGGPRKAITIAVGMVLPVGILLCLLLRLESYSYVLGTAMLVRLLELIPYWRYRDRAVAPATKVQAATMATSA